MEKRLSRTEYVFTLIFIFMLVCAVAAFFYGVNVGKQKAESKFAELNKKEAKPPELAAYDQQNLVSFYHTILLPYQEFQKKWFEHLNAIEFQSTTVDPSSLLKELEKVANEKYNGIITMSMPEKSPLLKQAHENYLKSLKLFTDAIKRIQSKTGALRGKALVTEIDNDPYFQEAKNFALKAQQNYFDSIVKWNQTVDPQLKGTDGVGKNNLPVMEWTQFNVNLKNAHIASLLQKGKYFMPYYPQDVTIRIDELIVSGQAKKLNLTEVDKMIEVLMGTGAVRPGDFLNDKGKWYGKETMPQLPFFFQ